MKHWLTILYHSHIRSFSHAKREHREHHSSTDYFFSCLMSVTLLEEEFLAGVTSSRLIGWIWLTLSAILAGVSSARGVMVAGVNFLSEFQLLQASTFLSLLTGVCIWLSDRLGSNYEVWDGGCWTYNNTQKG